MPNLAALLKSEITRLARREIRKEMQPLRKAAANYRREIASLKRAVTLLDRRAKSLAKVSVSDNAVEDASNRRQTRFVAKGLVSLRKRLGVSAADLARLLGVSMQSVYNWERKKASPRKEQVTAIVALRSVSKKAAHNRLQTLSRQVAAKTGSRKRPRRNS